MPNPYTISISTISMKKHQQGSEVSIKKDKRAIQILLQILSVLSKYIHTL